MTTQNDNSFPGVPRAIVIGVGALCFAVAAFFALAAVGLIFSLARHRGPSDRTVVGLVLAVCVVFAISFGVVGTRLCRDKAQRAESPPNAPLPKYNKHNDADWCMAVFGITGGVILLLLGRHEVVDVIRNHATSVIPIILLTLGIQALLTWQWKRRFLSVIQDLSVGLAAAASGPPQLHNVATGKGIRSQHEQSEPHRDREPHR